MSAKWDDRFLALAAFVATWSKDRSRRVGCVIVGPDNDVRSLGFNGFPRGVDDDAEERHERPAKYSWTEHAERNAIYNAARVGVPVKGCTAYLPWFPCMDCARALVQAGIATLVCGQKPDLGDPKWGRRFRERARDALRGRCWASLPDLRAMRPLAIDLFCGLGGWTEGLLSEGFDVIGFDIEQHVYGAHRYPAQLVLQDVRTIHGSQFRNASLIVASSPCQKYSYMAMPWTRAKEQAKWYRDPAHPERLAELNELFDQPARIQREACEAAGRFIPMVQENVCGAQPWVGRAQWRYGSYYLWGDVPALMPMTLKAQKSNPDWSKRIPGQAFNTHAERQTKDDGVKQGGGWFHDATGHALRKHSSKSTARKAASARIAKIPLPLAQWIAHCYHPARLVGDVA